MTRLQLPFPAIFNNVETIARQIKKKKHQHTVNKRRAGAKNYGYK
jgi:hypothetical protein